MAIELFNRQELKYVINQNQLENVLASIIPNMVSDKYNMSGRPYTIYNLYIDTDDNTLIRQSMNKPKFKEKIRIRSYKEFTPEQNVFLEVKKRYNKITNKRRTKILYKDALNFIRTGRVKLKSYMNQQVIREFEVMLKKNSYYPKTFITYDRRAFTCMDTNSDLRITFDTNLCAHRVKDDVKRFLLDKDKVIFEIKSTNNIPLWLVEVLSNEGIFKQSFSKYGQEYNMYLQSNRTIQIGGYNA